MFVLVDLTLRCLMETLSTDSGKTSAQDTGMEKNTDDRLVQCNSYIFQITFYFN